MAAAPDVPLTRWLASGEDVVLWERGFVLWCLRREARPDPPPEIRTAVLRGSEGLPALGAT